jgi:hypothetical protein
MLDKLFQVIKGNILHITGARLAAVFFLVHPSHVEAVASIVGKAFRCSLVNCGVVFNSK